MSTPAFLTCAESSDLGLLQDALKPDHPDLARSDCLLWPSWKSTLVPILCLVLKQSQ